MCEPVGSPENAGIKLLGVGDGKECLCLNLRSYGRNGFQRRLADRAGHQRKANRTDPLLTCALHLARLPRKKGIKSMITYAVKDIFSCSRYSIDTQLQFSYTHFFKEMESL
jgi:hypothetical protein